MFPSSVTPSRKCNVRVTMSPQFPAAVNEKLRLMVVWGAIAPYDSGPEGARILGPGSNVAMRLLVEVWPPLIIAKFIVTVSPGSTAPLAGGQLSLTRVLPAGDSSTAVAVSTMSVTGLSIPATTSRRSPIATPAASRCDTLVLVPGDQLLL